MALPLALALLAFPGVPSCGPALPEIGYGFLTGKANYQVLATLVHSTRNSLFRPTYLCTAMIWPESMSNTARLLDAPNRTNYPLFPSAMSSELQDFYPSKDRPPDLGTFQNGISRTDLEDSPWGIDPQFDSYEASTRSLRPYIDAG